MSKPVQRGILDEVCQVTSQTWCVNQLVCQNLFKPICQSTCQSDVVCQNLFKPICQASCMSEPVQCGLSSNLCVRICLTILYVRTRSTWFVKQLVNLMLHVKNLLNVVCQVCYIYDVVCQNPFNVVCVRQSVNLITE